MKNLKRVLSLALTGTMLAGMMTIGASAANKDFTDADEIQHTEAVNVMSTLGVLKGSNENGVLYANVNGYVTREETMTILGRILASSQSCDLSQFPDATLVSDWASPHVQTLVALNIVGGSNGLLSPKDYIDRAAIAKLLVEVYPLEKALLIPRLDLMA